MNYLAFDTTIHAEDHAKHGIWAMAVSLRGLSSSGLVDLRELKCSVAIVYKLVHECGEETGPLQWIECGGKNPAGFRHYVRVLLALIYLATHRRSSHVEHPASH